MKKIFIFVIAILLYFVAVNFVFAAGGGQAGQTNIYGYNYQNPWPDVKSIFDLINKVTNLMIEFAIPIAVALIIYAGIMFLTSAGDTGRINKAKTALRYTILGFGVLLIGKGFFLLVQSILNLK